VCHQTRTNFLHKFINTELSVVLCLDTTRWGLTHTHSHSLSSSHTIHTTHTTHNTHTHTHTQHTQHTQHTTHKTHTQHTQHTHPTHTYPSCTLLVSAPPPAPQMGSPSNAGGGTPSHALEADLPAHLQVSVSVKASCVSIVCVCECVCECVCVSVCVCVEWVL